MCPDNGKDASTSRAGIDSILDRLPELELAQRVVDVHVSYFLEKGVLRLGQNGLEQVESTCVPSSVQSESPSDRSGLLSETTKPGSAP